MQFISKMFDVETGWYYMKKLKGQVLPPIKTSNTDHDNVGPVGDRGDDKKECGNGEGYECMNNEDSSRCSFLSPNQFN